MTSPNVLMAYISYSASFVFELVLFFLALWAGVQCSRACSSTSWIGARRLRLILVEGNALLFLVWVSSLVYCALTDINRQFLCHAVYLVVFFTSSVRRRLSHEAPTPTTLVASIYCYRKQCCDYPIHHCRLLSHLEYSNCSRGVVF